MEYINICFITIHLALNRSAYLKWNEHQVHPKVWYLLWFSKEYTSQPLNFLYSAIFAISDELDQLKKLNTSFFHLPTAIGSPKYFPGDTTNNLPISCRCVWTKSDRRFTKFTACPHNSSYRFMILFITPASDC